MANTVKSPPLTSAVSARLTEAERRALDAILDKRREKLRADGFDPSGESDTAWIRAMIHREADAYGITIGAQPAEDRRATRVAPSRRTSGRAARRGART